jgi:hypothetical protein
VRWNSEPLKPLKSCWTTAAGAVLTNRLPILDPQKSGSAHKLRALMGCTTAAACLNSRDPAMEPEELLRGAAACSRSCFLRRLCVACTNRGLMWALPCTQAAATIVHGTLANVRGASTPSIVLFVPTLLLAVQLQPLF